jgi:hypothetical protein
MHRTRPQVSDRAHYPEKQIAEDHLGEFMPIGSRGLEFIERIAGTPPLTGKSLIVLARGCAFVANVWFPRDFTRRRDLVIKWFDDHIDTLEPLQAIMQIDTVSSASMQESDEQQMVAHDYSSM